MKTTHLKEQAPKWLLIDAAEQNLGRLAARVAMLLRGKHKHTFSPHMLSGDFVVIVNAEKLSFEASKLRRKVYFTHSGYLGSLTRTPLDRLYKEKPERVLELAIRGMLPKNRQRLELMRRLHIVRGPEHRYAAQKPIPTTVS